MVASERLGYTTKVYPGHTLEICIAQYWSSLGDSSLNVDIQFRGVSPNEKTITFANGENILRVDLKSHLVSKSIGSIFLGYLSENLTSLISWIKELFLNL